MLKEEKWIKVAELQKLYKLKENLEIYFPIEDLLKENKIKYKYKIEERLDYINNATAKNVKKAYFINLYVEQSDEIRTKQIIKEYEEADFVSEELTDVEDEVVQKTIPAIILPYIYIVLLGIITCIMSIASFENIILKIIGIAIGIIIIIYAVKNVIQKILKRKKEE